MVEYNLYVSFFKTSETKSIEELLIFEFNPFLNIQKTRHDYVDELKQLRTTCRNEAKINDIRK